MKKEEFMKKTCTWLICLRRTCTLDSLRLLDLLISRFVILFWFLYCDTLQMKHFTKAQLFFYRIFALLHFCSVTSLGFPTLLIVSRQVSFMNESILKDRARLFSQGNKSARTQSKTFKPKLAICKARENMQSVLSVGNQRCFHCARLTGQRALGYPRKIGTTFPHHTGPTKRNGHYHFLFLLRIPYVSEIYWKEVGQLQFLWLNFQDLTATINFLSPDLDRGFEEVMSFFLKCCMRL